jgi:hypothetical protein
MLRDRKRVFPFGLAVPTSDARQAVRDVLDLDIEGRWIEKVKAAAAQHALPSSWLRGGHGIQSSTDLAIVGQIRL